MFSKHAAGWVVLSGAVALSGVLLTRALRESAAGRPGGGRSTDSYAAKVEALRASFAAERKNLGLRSARGDESSPETDLGAPSACGGSGGSARAGGVSGAKCAAKATCEACSKGAPVWVVNMANLNLYMVDTPLWYRSPIGPPVALRLSYNSLTSLGGTFGSKWQLNYGTYLHRVTDNGGGLVGIMIIMPDGKQDLYLADGSGGYRPPYHTFNRLTELAPNRFQLAFPDGMAYLYDSPPAAVAGVSALAEVRDAYGQKLTMGYDAEGRLTGITDALGRVTTLSLNSAGLVTRATDPFERAASFEYDANGNLIRITDMGGYWTALTYDRYSLTDYYPASLSNAVGTWGFTFEPADGLGDGADPYPAPGAPMGLVSRLTVTNPFGGRQEYYRREAVAWQVSARDYVPYAGPGSNTSASSVPKTLYTFTTTSGSRREVASIVTPEGNTTVLEYGDASSPGSITAKARGLSRFAYTYNRSGRITSITDPSGRSTALSYAANGVDLTGITDGLGTVALTYNDAHAITSLTTRGGQRTETAYDAYGRIVSMTDALGIMTTYLYGPDQFLAEVQRNGQTLRKYTYDAMGRVRTDTDATGLTRTYAYNALDDITSVSYPEGTVAGVAYSNAFPHLVTATTDPGGLTTEYVRDASGALAHTVDPAGLITSFGYDANGNQVQLADPNGQVTSFAYDKDNRLIRKTYADGSTSARTYTALGRIESLTGPRNLSTYYAYTVDNDLARVSYTPDLEHYTDPILLQYDAYRRVAAMVDGLGTTTFTYSPDSVLTGIDGPLDADALTFQYNAVRQLAGYTLENGQSVTYGRDALGRLTQVLCAAGTFSYSYTGASPLVQRLTRPNGSYTEYQYDALNRLVGVANRRASGETISQYEYTFDAHNRRASETVTNGPSVGALAGGTTTYTYSNTNGLLNSVGPARSFAYDREGNMTLWYNPEGKPYTGVYDIRNRLISASYEHASLTPPLDYESSAVTYRYGGGDTVREKEETYVRYSTGTHTKKTVRYVGYGLLTLQERDEDNNVLREYTWGRGLAAGIGGLLGIRQGGQHYSCLYDGRGNVTAVIDASQAVVATYAYDPFGNLVAKAGSLDQPYQFSTKPYDATTGLADFGYRFYSPVLGRWITRDPLGESVGPNLYAFVNDDPVNHLDPTGLEQCKVVTLRTCSEEPGVPSSGPTSGPVTNGDGDYCVDTSGCSSAPDDSIWDMITKWLDDLVKPGELKGDRVLGYPCRIVAGTGWFPGMDLSHGWAP